MNAKRMTLAAMALMAGTAAALAGAPASFEVRAAAVTVRRTGTGAEVRYSYDLSVRNPACGWFMADFPGLPAGKDPAKAALVVDGKEYPLALDRDRSGLPTASAWRDEGRDEGRRVLMEAKSVRLVLTLPTRPCEGPEFPVPLLLPRPDYQEYPGDKRQETVARLTVDFGAETDASSAEVRATFRDVPGGARLVLRSDAVSAGARVEK